ncbi:MAG TPA: hypothetical protein VF618_24785 [Thermoanaerobaculia bacterium]
MIGCDAFRSRFVPATDDAKVLEHLRACDACLDHAAGIDPDVIFRAIGVEEMVPPGGVDAFVDDVMRQVRVREAEATVDSHPARPVLTPVLTWTRRLAIAATLTGAISGATMFYFRAPASSQGVHIPTVAMLRPAATTSVALVSQPAIERYDSNNATIVEVPAETADTQIVMIFDEDLPADL